MTTQTLTKDHEITRRVRAAVNAFLMVKGLKLPGGNAISEDRRIALVMDDLPMRMGIVASEVGIKLDELTAYLDYARDAED